MADDISAVIPHAKDLSKLFKILCTLGLIVCAVLKWLGIFNIDGIGEVCALWSVVYGIGAGTIDANLIINNIKGKVS